MLDGIIKRLLRTVAVLEQEIKDNEAKPEAEKEGEEWLDEQLENIGEIYDTLRTLGWEPEQ